MLEEMAAPPAAFRPLKEELKIHSAQTLLVLEKRLAVATFGQGN